MSIFLSILHQGEFQTKQGNSTYSRGRIIDDHQTGTQRQNGNWSRWKWDGTQLNASTSAGSHPSLYYFCNDSQIAIGDSLQQVAAISKHTSINWTAAAEILLFGVCIGQKTIYQDVHIIPAGSDLSWRTNHLSLHIDGQLPPQQSDISYDQAIEEYLYLLNKAVLRRLPSGKFAMGISGGRDSRHILLLLLRHGIRPEKLFSSEHYLSFSGNEITIARKLGHEYNLAIDLVLPDTCRITAEIEKNSALGLQTLSHSWGLNLSRALSTYSTIYDGIGSGVFGRTSLSALLRNTYHGKKPSLANIEKAVFNQCALTKNRIRNLISPELFNAFDFYKAQNNFIKELQKYKFYPNIAQTYLQFTNRGTSFFTYPLNTSNEILCPFDDIDLINFAITLPWNISNNKRFQNDALIKDFPQHKHIEFSNEMPDIAWYKLDREKEFLSFQQLNQSIFNKPFLQKASSKKLALNEIQYACFCSSISESNDFLHLQLQNQKNRLGSLHGDIDKLTLAKHTLVKKNKKLRQNLKTQTASSKKAQKKLLAVKKSASWKTGYVTVKAFTKPGIDTLLLPYRLLKILSNHSNQNKKQEKPSKTDHTLNCKQTRPTLSPNPTCKQSKTFSLQNLTTPFNPAKLRVASIVDEFTYNCFNPECDLFQLSPNNWQQEIETFTPDLLFVEAAWRGKDDLWTGKIKKCSKETRDLLNWCNENSIPTAFWAKEDPSDFDSFLRTAKLFDFIFTTDIDCIKKYKENKANAKIFLLPFAAQPKLHNPVEKVQRKDLFCFAGAYYLHFPERQKDFETIYDALSDIKGVDIYDRNYHDDRNLFMFPDKYKASIVGNLPNSQIDTAYKGYRYAINMNSIKDSNSMFARRVFELLASNTVIISNYSKGIHNFFGDLVISTDDKKEIKKCLTPILHDECYYRKFKLAGLRKVLQTHTYADRLSYMAQKIWAVQPKTHPHVTILAKVTNSDEFETILAAYSRQSYANKSLILVQTNSFDRHLPDDSTIQVQTRATVEDMTLGDVVESDFVAGFAYQDYYGPHYLTDIMLATRYSSSPVLGKGAWYEKQENDIVLQNDLTRYSLVSGLPIRSCIFRVTFKRKSNMLSFLEQLSTNTINYNDCLSIDEFNYCRNYTGTTCAMVDDLQELNCGSNLSQLR